MGVVKNCGIDALRNNITHFNHKKGIGSREMGTSTEEIWTFRAEIEEN